MINDIEHKLMKIFNSIQSKQFTSLENVDYEFMKTTSISSIFFELAYIEKNNQAINAFKPILPLKDTIEAVIDAFNYCIQHDYQNFAYEAIKAIQYQVPRKVCIYIIKYKRDLLIRKILEGDLLIQTELKVDLEEQFPRNDLFNCRTSLYHLVALCLIEKLGDEVELIESNKKYIDQNVIIALLKYNSSANAIKFLSHIKITEEIFFDALTYNSNEFIRAFDVSLIFDANKLIKELSSKIKLNLIDIEIILSILRKIYTKADVIHCRMLISALHESICGEESISIYYVNPLKIIILGIELAILVSKLHGILMYDADDFKASALKLASLIQSVLSLKQMELMMNDKDIDGRIVIFIASTTDYTSLYSPPKMNTIVMRYWNGEFNHGEGNLLSTSNLYKSLSESSKLNITKSQFIRKYDINHSSTFMFCNWKSGLKSRFIIEVISELILMVTTFMLAYIALQDAKKGLKNFAIMNATNNFDPPFEELSTKLIENARLKLHLVVKIISLRWIPIANYIYLFIVCKIKKKSLGDILGLFILDLCYFIIAFYTGYDLLPRYADVAKVAAGMDRLMAFQYLALYQQKSQILALSTLFLLLKVGYYMRTNKYIGPFLKTIIYIVKQLFYFLIIYVIEIIVFSFTIVIMDVTNGNENFDTLTKTLIYLFEASLNGFDFTAVTPSKVQLIAYVVFIIFNSIILINMLIGIVSNIYNEVQSKINEYILIDIIKQFRYNSTNDEYGSVICLPAIASTLYGITPLLITACARPKAKPLVNLIFLYIAYSLIIFPVLLVILIGIEVIVFPFAYLIALYSSLFSEYSGSRKFKDICKCLFLNVLLIPLIILVDIYYFIAQSLRRGLNSNINHAEEIYSKSKLMLLCNEASKYIGQNITKISAEQLLKAFHTSSIETHASLSEYTQHMFLNKSAEIEIKDDYLILVERFTEDGEINLTAFYSVIHNYILPYKTPNEELLNGYIYLPLRDAVFEASFNESKFMRKLYDAVISNKKTQ